MNIRPDNIYRVSNKLLENYFSSNREWSPEILKLPKIFLAYKGT